MVGFRPFLAPALEGASILKGTWSLLEQRQVMQRIEDILLMTVTASMAGNHRTLMQDVNAERIGFDHQLTSRLLDGDRVAVGVIDHLTVGSQMDLACDTTGKGALGQWVQVRSLRLPRLSNTHGLPLDDTHIVAFALGEQMHIEFLKGGHVRDGHHEVAAMEADTVLEARGDIFVIPDILCNAGGVAVSYFEWVQDLQSFFWTETEVVDKLFRILEGAFNQTLSLSRKQKISMRLAALSLGVLKVANEKARRGLFP